MDAGSNRVVKNSLLQSGERRTKEFVRVVKNFVEINPRFDFQLGYVKLLSSLEPLGSHIHLDSYEIVYMYKGIQYYRIDGEDYHVSSGKMIISPPGVLHSSGYEPENKSTFYYLTVNIDALPNFFLADLSEGEEIKDEISHLALTKRRVFDIISPKKLEVLLKRLIELHKAKDTDIYIKTHVRNTISEIILITIESARRKNLPSMTETMDDIIEYIDRHIEEKISVDDLACIKNFSKSAFQQKFTEHMGIPVYEYVMRRKIEMAMILLEADSVQKKDIWERLSFCSQQYFTTVFKKYTGVTPTQYLRLIRSESEE